MRIRPVQLQNMNQLAHDYRNQENDIQSYFDYKPFNTERKRLEDLKNRTFHRVELSDILHKMNALWDAPMETKQQIDRLQDENSVIVIGGQQAGLMTGPMYTINKIISILAYAKEQEAKLNVPVIPVFWIAGEDHDYDEINHTYSCRDNKLYKHMSKQQLYLKKSIGHIEIDQEKTLQWINELFHDYVETQHTKHLYESFVSCLQKSTSYVDFFARIIFNLFPTEGIVLINSSDSNLRQLESEWFTQLIHNQPAISKSVYESVQKLQQQGYPLTLEVEKEDAHLFYHDENNERILLKRDGESWIGKNDEIKLTTDQLLQLAAKTPERLSNNVVTRPIMQELMFPTLAFIGGDGEISYWAALKGAFRAVDDNMKVPPVLPRLSFTFITKRLEKLLTARVIDPEYVINHGIEELKSNWLLSQQTPQVDILYEEVKEQMEQIHSPLRLLAQSVSGDLHEEAQKNIQLIHRHISYLKLRTMKKLEEKYAHELAQYEEIGNYLKPNQLLQERIWNPLLFLNEYGSEFLQEITQEHEFSFLNHHYLIYID